MPHYAAVSYIKRKLWYLGKPLEDAREKVRRLEEDERTLTWMLKIDDARRRRVERMVSDLEPQSRVRRMMMRLFGMIPADMVWDMAGALFDPVADELEDLRKRLADARMEFDRLDGEHRHLTRREEDYAHDLRQYQVRLHGAEPVRRFEAPGRVRTALVRMVEDVFATIGRQDEACDADDTDELWRLREVELAQRAQLHGLWRIDPVFRMPGTWTAVTKEKTVAVGKGMHLPSARAERLTRERLKEARIAGCPAEIRRLEEEKRLLTERSRELRRARHGLAPRPAGLLAPPRDGACGPERIVA